MTLLFIAIAAAYLGALDAVFNWLVQRSSSAPPANRVEHLTRMFRWYVINTYSGHENKVKHNLEHRIETMGQRQASARSWSPPSRSPRSRTASASRSRSARCPATCSCKWR